MTPPAGSGETEVASLLFGLAIFAAAALIPYGLFRFVVNSTERDLAVSAASGQPAFTAERPIWASFKMGVYFGVLGPVMGALIFMAPVLWKTTGSFLGLAASMFPVFLLAWFVSLGGAFFAGCTFAFCFVAMRRHAYPVWPVRLLAGSVAGVAGGLLVSDVHKIMGLEASLLLCATSGALCGLVLTRSMHRFLLLRPTNSTVATS